MKGHARRGRALRWWVLLWLLVGVSPLQAGLSRAGSSPSQLQEALGPRRWALVVGIDTYADRAFTPLGLARADARALAQALRDPQVGAFDEVVLLDEPQQTTRSALLAQLRRVRAELGPRDTFLLYFSGHGTAEPGEEGQEVYYLAPSDAKMHDLWGSALELGALLDFLETFAPERRVAIFDACFSGQGRSAIPQEVQRRLAALPPGSRRAGGSLERADAVLMATTLGGVAHEDDRLGHGLFTWSLLQGLTRERSRADSNSDGALTAWEWHDYARERTVGLSQGAQIPEAWFRVAGRADVVISGADGGALVADARVYAYGAQGYEGLRLEIDGRTRGSFPRTVTVPAGERELVLKDGQGEVIAAGRLHLRPGEVYSAQELERVLRSKEVWATVSGISASGLGGEGSLLWGRGFSGARLSAGHQQRGGRLSGLAIEGAAAVAWTEEGAWASGEERPRPIALGDVSAGWRGWGGPVQLGAALWAGPIFLPAVAPDPAADPASLAASAAWWGLWGGPRLSLGVPVSQGVSLTSQVWGAWSNLGGPSAWTSGAGHLVLGVGAGVEVGR